MKSLSVLSTVVIIYLTSCFMQRGLCSPEPLLGLNDVGLTEWNIRSNPKEAKISQHTKRQTTRSNLTPKDIADCLSIQYDYRCSSGLAQSLVDAYSICGDSSAYSTSIECARSENGEFCATAFEQFNLNGTTLMNFEVSCSRSVSSNSCPPSCHTLLQDFRSRLGCCINTYINTTHAYSAAIYGPYVDYRLWDLCGVSPPAADCGNALPVNNTAYQGCTDEEFFRRVHQNACAPSMNQPLINALLNNSKCYYSAKELIHHCTFNANGQPCLLAVSLYRDFNEYMYEAYSNLIDRSGCAPNYRCNSTCESAINVAKNAAGCCVNYFNISGIAFPEEQYPSLSYSVWKSCGVETPGFCSSTLSLGGTLSGAMPTIVMAVTWIITAALIAVAFHWLTLTACMYICIARWLHFCSTWC